MLEWVAGGFSATQLWLNYLAFLPVPAMIALAAGVPSYDALWRQLGPPYTAHGGLMVLGGLAFGWATLRGGALPAWTAMLFLAGVCANLVLALLPVPELLQTLGSGLRNAGLAAMGWTLWRT